MTVVVKRPDTMFRTFDQLLDEFFGVARNAASTVPTLTRPAVNIIETKDAFRLELALPGLDKSDVNVKVENEVLTITAKREFTPQDGEIFKRQEFGAVNFVRSFQLPDTIDNNGIEARYENGILRVVLNKKETARPQPARLININ